MKNKICFCLPPKGVLEPVDKDDPLGYYYRPIVGALYRNRIKQALALLEPPYRSVLEIGYGSGILLPTLNQLAENVYGVDIKSNPEKVAASLSGLGVRANLSRADILTVDYPKASFDLIIAISVFEHIIDLRPILSRLSGFLRQDGQLLVGMPRVDNLMKMIFTLIGFNNIEAHHVSDYKQLIKSSEGLFGLSKFAGMPCWAPKPMGLYFNMLFNKI
ncbi:MAG: class I SAM-dependent methyltransferase [Candidatus Omnitrophota bacterium]